MTVNFVAIVGWRNAPSPVAVAPLSSHEATAPMRDYPVISARICVSRRRLPPSCHTCATPPTPLHTCSCSMEAAFLWFSISVSREAMRSCGGQG